MTVRSEGPGSQKRDDPDLGVSKRALFIARTIDRVCRSPGNYQIILIVPSHRRDSWTLQLQRTETLRKVEIRR